MSRTSDRFTGDPMLRFKGFLFLTFILKVLLDTLITAAGCLLHMEMREAEKVSPQRWEFNLLLNQMSAGTQGQQL